MNDTDRINAYAYKGDDYTGDLAKYLISKGLTVSSVEWENGWVIVNGKQKLPQYMRWGKIAERMRA